MGSVPPPSSPTTPELVLPLDEPRNWREPRSRDGDRLKLSASGVSIAHGRVMRAPLELALGAVKVATVDAGPAAVTGESGRFAVLRRVSPTTVIPRRHGIEGWLWTSTGEIQPCGR